MPPFTPVPDSAQAEVLYLLDGQVIENRLWFHIDFPPFGLTELQALADGLQGWWAANIMPYLSEDILLIYVTAKDWTTAGGTVAVSTGSTVFGGIASPTCSANVALSVRFKWPTFRAKQRKNKHFLPGIPNSVVDLNTPDLTWAESVWDSYVALQDDAPFFNPDNRWRWAVASAWSGGSLRTEQLV